MLLLINEDTLYKTYVVA